jgi:phosphatidylglycerophosphate synthase
MPGQGPRFLRLRVAERNSRVAARAFERDYSLAGTLRFAEDSVLVTQALFDWLPREGSWTIDWHPGRPAFLWESARGHHGATSHAIAPEGAIIDVQTSAARRAALWTLLQRSGKPTDGWLSRTIHRRVSRVLSYGLLQLGLEANHATLLTVAIGALAAAFIAHTSHWTMIVGAFLFWFASIADGMDGEMARLTLSESARGDQLDTFADIATYVLCLLAVTVGWVRQGTRTADVVLAAVIALGVPTTLLYAMHLVRRASGSSQFFLDTKPMESAVKTAAVATGSPLLRLAANVWLLFRRESFSLVFFLGSLLTGWRGYGPSALAAGLVFVLFTLFVYGAPIDGALRHNLSQSMKGEVSAVSATLQASR